VISHIATTSSINLGLPLVRELVPPPWETPSVPKVAIYEDGYTLVPKDKVRTSRQIPNMALPGKAR